MAGRTGWLGVVKHVRSLAHTCACATPSSIEALRSQRAGQVFSAVKSLHLYLQKYPVLRIDAMQGLLVGIREIIDGSENSIPWDVALAGALHAIIPPQPQTAEDWTVLELLGSGVLLLVSESKDMKGGVPLELVKRILNLE
ncbi:hypothetical protein AAMO2058_000081800, partial [Amorphochlora amoebiformis]